MKPLLDRLRGARHIELFAALVVLAVIALVVTGTQGRAPRDTEGSALERRLEELLSRIDGVSGVGVMLTTDDEDKIIGAVIVLERLDGIRQAIEIQEAVRTLLGVEAKQIRIIGRELSMGGGAE